MTLGPEPTHLTEEPSSQMFLWSHNCFAPNLNDQFKFGAQAIGPTSDSNDSFHNNDKLHVQTSPVESVMSSGTIAVEQNLKNFGTECWLPGGRDPWAA